MESKTRNNYLEFYYQINVPKVLTCPQNSSNKIPRIVLTNFFMSFALAIKA